jgi:hypothetical protein
MSSHVQIGIKVIAPWRFPLMMRQKPEMAKECSLDRKADKEALTSRPEL